MTQQEATKQGDKIEKRTLRKIDAIFRASVKGAMQAASTFFDALKRALDAGAPEVIASDPDRLKRWRMAQGETLIRVYRPDETIAESLMDATLAAEAEAEGALSEVYTINYQATVNDVNTSLAALGLSIALLRWARTSQGLPPARPVRKAKRPQTLTYQLDGKRKEKPPTGSLWRALNDVETPLTPGKGQNARVPLFSSLPSRVQETILREIKRGIAAGESQEKMISRVQAIVADMPKWKARQIVQTERTRIQSRARFDASEEARAEGLEMDREWVARFHNTRDSHAAMHGQIAMDGKPFVSGMGSIMYYPGDRSNGAPPADTINCHCHTRERLRSGSPALSAIRRRTGESAEAWLDRTRRNGTYNRWRDSIGR